MLGVFAKAFEEKGPACTQDRDKRALCKPAGASVVVLPNGKLVYWDALEGMEDVRYNVVAEYGRTAQNDVSRQLDIRSGTPVFKVPGHVDGGANPKGNPNADYLPIVPHNNADTRNDGDLFCSDQVFLADGSVLDVGGTSYYLEPGNDALPYGVTELEGLKNSRIYDPVKNDWRQSGTMAYGRWYPSLVTLPNGNVFVASGVTKLLKPVYPDRPADSGTNVKQTETYNPKTGKFSTNPSTADKSLPLFPRLHLLPDGKVYFDAAGQTFNPFGQSIDEALWNMTSVYDPKTQTWTDKGLPAFGPALLGFRGSGFSQELTLKPPYKVASFLGAGGVYGVSPGSYLATNTATVNSIDTANGDAFSTKNVAPMHTARWYGTGVTLPTGQVVVFNGATADEVAMPSSAMPVTTPELYDPATDTWTQLASQGHGRTYHNTAVLLPDGRILVGGHSPIGSFYAFQTNALTPLGFSNPFRDPSFEIYSPPYLFQGSRPVITDVADSVGYGKTLRIKTPDASRLASVVLVRNPAITHLVDGDQKVIELPVVARHADSVDVTTPPSSAIAPTGPYMLFLNAKTSKGVVPSVSRQVFVGTSTPKAYVVSAKDKAATVRKELAARKASGAAPAASTASKPAEKAAKTHAAAVGDVAPAVRTLDSVTASADSPIRDDAQRAALVLLATGLIAWTGRTHAVKAYARARRRGGRR